MTKLQQLFIESLTSEQEQEQAQTRIKTGVPFYAIAIDTACGYSFGSSSVNSKASGKEESIPLIYLDREEAEEEMNETIEHYNEEIQSGERDADDVYEGILAGVIWGKDDTMSIVDLDSNEVIAYVTAKDSMGM